MEYTLEDHLSITLRDGAPTHIGELFRRLVRLLESNGMPYAFVGVLALDQYISDFKFTDKIILVGAPGLEAGLGEQLAAIAHNKRYRHVQVRLDCTDFPANEHVLQNRVQRPLFGIAAPFASPLSLAWLFLESDQSQDRIDAGQLLYDGAVSAEELRTLLEKHQAQHALDRLAEAQASIERGGYSGSYNESVKARLARLKR